MFRKPLNNRTSRPEEFCKQVFLKISKNSEEHTSIRVPFSVQFQVKGCNFIKKRLQRRCFPVKYATFILQNISSGIKSSQTVLLQIIYYDATVWLLNEAFTVLLWNNIKNFSCSLNAENTVFVTLDKNL